MAQEQVIVAAPKSHTGLIIGVLVAVVALGVAGYFILKPKKATGSTNSVGSSGSKPPTKVNWASKSAANVYDVNGNIIGNAFGYAEGDSDVDPSDDFYGAPTITVSSYTGNVYDHTGKVITTV